MNSVSKSVMLLCITTVATLTTLAQEKEKDVNVNVDLKGGDSQWYQQPWVWIVGAAVFILLLIALLRGSSSAKE